jgi:hypothetical protein
MSGEARCQAIFWINEVVVREFGDIGCGGEGGLAPHTPHQRGGRDDHFLPPGELRLNLAATS